jgi:hypothetical protein
MQGDKFVLNGNSWPSLLVKFVWLDIDDGWREPTMFGYIALLDNLMV